VRQSASADDLAGRESIAAERPRQARDRDRAEKPNAFFGIRQPAVWSLSGAQRLLALQLYQGARPLTHEDAQARSLARSGWSGDVVHRREAATKSSGRGWAPCGRRFGGPRTASRPRD